MTTYSKVRYVGLVSCSKGVGDPVTCANSIPAIAEQNIIVMEVVLRLGGACTQGTKNV